MFIMKNIFRNNSSLILSGAIFSVAFILRFIYLLQIKGTPFIYHLTVDPDFYHNWALKIVGGEWWGNEAFVMSPLYSYFLALIYTLITTDIYIVRFIQIFIGSVGCVLIFSIASTVFDRRSVGLLAGLMAAFYGPFIFYDGMIMKTFLAVFFTLCMTFFLLRHSKTVFLAPFLSGIALALGALIRENIILLIPIILLWLVISGRKNELSSTAKTCLAFIIGMALIIGPVTLRNYAVEGEFVLITTIGGENFYLGNNAYTDGYYRIPDYVTAVPLIEREGFRRKASELTGRELNLKESSEYWFAQGVNFIKEEPASFVKLTLRKLMLFWNFYEAPDNYNYYFQKKFSSLLKGPVFHFGIIAPLGLLGIILSLGRARRLAILYIIFFGYMSSFILFFNLSRYRLSMVPFLIIFASYTVWWFYDKVNARQLKVVAATGTALILLFLASNYHIKGHDPYSEDFDGSYAKLGSAFVKTGEYDKAVKSFKNAIRLNPSNAQLHFNMGNTLFQKGDIDQAQQAYASAIYIDPSYGEAYNGMGNVLATKKELDLAATLYKRAIELSPGKPEHYSNLGFLLYDQRLFEDSIARQQDAIKVDPEYTNSYYGLALAFEASGQYEKAIFHWKQFMSLSKENKWLEEARKRLKRLERYNRQ